jgi:hypothetical protein
MSDHATITTGAVVRDRKWGGRYTGTVVRVEGDSIFVQWHGTSVEDQLDPADVTLAPDVPSPLTFHSGWRFSRVTIPEE